MNIEQIFKNIETHYLALSRECRDELAMVSKILTIDKETKIVTEGQYADKSYFIAKGCARAFYLKAGRDITDWFAFENDFI